MTEIFSSHMYRSPKDAREFVNSVVEDDRVFSIKDNKIDAQKRAPVQISLVKTVQVLFFSVLAFFSSKRELNKELSLVNKKVKEFYEGIKDPNSDIARGFIQALRREKYKGLTALMFNLRHIDIVLDIDNDPKTIFEYLESFRRSCLNAMDACKKSLGCRVVKRNFVERGHAITPLGKLMEEIQSIADKAFQPTEEDLKNLEYSIDVTGGNAEKVKSDFAKLQLGFTPKSEITLGDYKYGMNRLGDYKCCMNRLGDHKCCMNRDQKSNNEFYLYLITGPEPEALKRLNYFQGPPKEFINKGPLEYSVKVDIINAKGVEGTKGAATLYKIYEFKKSVFGRISGGIKSSRKMIIRENETYSLSGGGVETLTFTIKKKS